MFFHYNVVLFGSVQSDDPKLTKVIGGLFDKIKFSSQGPLIIVQKTCITFESILPVISNKRGNIVIHFLSIYQYSRVIRQVLFAN